MALASSARTYEQLSHRIGISECRLIVDFRRLLATVQGCSNPCVSAESKMQMSDSFNTNRFLRTIIQSMTRRELIAGMAGAGASLAVRGEAAMQRLEKTKILFIDGFGPIVRDMDASRSLYAEALEIAFKEESGGYLHTSALQGAKEFALWPLSQAAESCFGSNTWPDSVPSPHAWLEFDVESVESATAELESRGYRMLIKNKREPWGQTVSRFLDSDGLLIGLTFTPSMREKK